MRGGNWKDKAIKGLAWASFVLAVIAGAALTDTFIGGTVAGGIGWLPNWVAILLLIAGAVAAAVDLFVDGVPNRTAIGIAIALPSVARAVPGRLSDQVTGLSRQMLDHANSGGLGAWVGTTSALGLAVAVAAAAWIIARRTVRT